MLQSWLTSFAPAAFINRCMYRRIGRRFSVLYTLHILRTLPIWSVNVNRRSTVNIYVAFSDTFTQIRFINASIVAKLPKHVLFNACYSIFFQSAPKLFSYRIRDCNNICNIWNLTLFLTTKFVHLELIVCLNIH